MLDIILLLGVGWMLILVLWELGIRPALEVITTIIATISPYIRRISWKN